VPRIAAGSAGWFRSLPVGRRASRLSAGLSVIVAEIPLLLLPTVLIVWIMAPDRDRIAAHVAGLIVGAAAAGLAVLPAASARWTRVIPLSACFASFAGGWASLAASSALLILAAVWPEKGAPAPRGPRREVSQALFFPTLSLRAVRARMALAYVPAAAFLAAARLFLDNNRPGPRLAQAISFLAAGLSLAGFLGIAADLLAARRPAWPWLRSLPRSAAARVLDDVLLLALLALPLTAGLSVLARPIEEAAFLIGPAAWLSVRAAGIMRGSGDRPFGVLGQIGIEGSVISLALALWPWISFLFWPAVPVAFLLARDAERRVKPTRWLERHHSNAGDPLSWSAS
jgi:hypothetical protein